ncbi:cytochrome P450 [Artemisia annua]|uniref:Cytochrome P450 n=1 Tax=Artemisia annua TaxID=35608 RepID=A0A2U1KNG7_ARTAN|nr:cytochrome P450 [Artemisia annua]
MALLKDLGSLWWQVSNNNEFTIAVTISVIIAMIIWCTLSLSSSSQTLPPGPRSLPIVGYLPFLNPELHKQFTNLAHTYGPIFKIYLGSKLHIVINTPELVKVVVRDQDEIFSNRDLTVAASAYSYEGRDLVLSNNNANWRNLRKMFVHELLSKKNLEACSSFRRYEVRKTINNIFSKIGTKINIYKDLGSLWWQVSNNNEFTIAVVTISVVIIAIIIWCTLSLSSSSQTLPPGPRSLPIVGYLPFLNPELHKQFTNLAHTYGPIFKIYLGSKLHIVINTPELVKVVVRDQDEIFSNRDLTVAASAYSYEGRDLVLSNNNSNWRNLRKMFVHELLSKKNLEACSSFRRYEVRKTINKIFSKIGTKINIYEISFSTEANVIASMVWENTYVKGTHDSDFGAELQMVSAKVNEIFGQLNLSDFFPSLAWFDLNGIKREMLRQRNKLDKLMTGIIEDQSKEKSQDGVGDNAKKDFLQKLLDLKDDQKDPKSVNLIQIKALLSVLGPGIKDSLREWVSL